MTLHFTEMLLGHIVLVVHCHVQILVPALFATPVPVIGAAVAPTAVKVLTVQVVPRVRVLLPVLRQQPTLYWPCLRLKTPSTLSAWHSGW